MSAVAGAEDILHETSTRLRLRVSAGAETATALAARIREIDGVEAVRANAAARCIVIHHDGLPQTREAVLARASQPALPWSGGATTRRKRIHRTSIAAPMLAATLPMLPVAVRGSATLAAIGLRVLAQPGKLRTDPAGILLDATSLGALAVSDQEPAVAASILLRDLSERLSQRFIRHADRLLDDLIPHPAGRYQVLGPGEAQEWIWKPVRALRPGHEVRLFSGDVVPVDACVVAGEATLAGPAALAARRAVGAGDHVAAGERLRDGTINVRAEADAASSRLQRLEDHLQHAIVGREPMGRHTPKLERALSLPLTAAVLVLGFTGNAKQAARMLHADPQKGLDLAVPLAREAALYAVARQGLLAGGLESVERLGAARTLVLQDAGVLASGRWTIESVRMDDGSDPRPVHAALAALADIPVEVLGRASFPDLAVRQWVRHGALLRTGAADMHLVSAARARRLWGLRVDCLPASEVLVEPLRRVLFVVRDARILGRVVLASPLRAQAVEQVRSLTRLGFEQIAVFVEADGGDAPDAPAAVPIEGLPGVLAFPDDRALRREWLAHAHADGLPVVLVHTVLRDLLPPGSLSLTPVDADAGAHGVLLGDPLASLVAARSVARQVRRRLLVQHDVSSIVNAGLLLASALRWLPAVGTAFLQNGFSIALLLDALRIEALGRALPRPGSLGNGQRAISHGSPPLLISREAP